MKTILAVDGNSVINRAYFGVKPLNNAKGERTEAIYGTLNMILSQTDRYRPDCVIAAFDLHAPTFRHKMYDAYKAGRKPMEEALCSQMEPAKTMLRALGCEVVSLEGYEADDLLGSIARVCEEKGDTCLILTGDRDSLQLISDTTSVLLLSKGEATRYDRSVFFEKYGIDPGQFADAKALMGDSSDNIPGVPGVGEKTALPLIARFGSLDGVYEHLDDPAIKEGLRKKLAENKESAYLSRRLAVICRTAPAAFAFPEFRPKPELNDVLSDLGFTRAIERLHLQKAAEEPAKEREKRTYRPVSALPEIAGDCGVLLDDDGLYVSAREGDFFLKDPTPAALSLFFTKDRRAAVYDSKNFLRRLFRAGIEDYTPTDDPMLAAYVLSSTDGDYRFGALCARFLSERAQAPDACDTARLTAVLREKLREQGSLFLYEQIELPTAAVLARMEEAGFLLDREGIAAFGEILGRALQQEEEEIGRLAGESFNVNSPKQLGHILYEKLGLQVYGAKKTKNGYSTNAETLEKLRGQHEIVGRILEYRQLSKLRGTYTQGLLAAAGSDGRVHTCFTQTVTATGRLSSVEPNLQNIPVRTDLGKELRRFFIAPQGRVLIDADYSQIELRLLAHMSGDETMIEAFRSGTDVHAATASEIFGVPVSAVTPGMRKQAKAVNFGIVYGISAFSLADDIKVSRKEAEAYIAGYFATYPGIEKYMKDRVLEGAKNGYVTTLWNRRRYIPELTAGKGQLKKFGERVAMNSPVQGSAADVIKIAMVRADRALREAGLDARLILQVHDELIVESSEKDAPEAAKILRQAMEGAAQLSVPLTVDLQSGKTWYECK